MLRNLKKLTQNLNIMRKISVLVVLLFVALSSWSAYYVAGNGTSGNPWCDGKSWVVNGSAMTQNDGVWTITFSSVPVGSYQFKVTNGSSTWIGFSKFSDDCSNLYAVSSGNDDNVSFNIQQQQNITITYNGSVICLRGSVGNNYPDPSKYAQVGVPSEYEGVMLQAFYWDSNSATTYSNTKYSTLANYIDEIGDLFDLVWFPPSGNGGGVGYYTKCYSNLSSAWGNKSQLQSLISSLHSHGCKAIADIVINHQQSASGWAKSFNSCDFGEYGTYRIESKYICAGDEAFTDSSSDSRSLAHGNADTGTNDEGCRDLDHTQTYVQQMCEAYTKWMINNIGFDGFRYDMTRGYAGSYLSQYNLASQPFFSVSEYWMDDVTSVVNHLKDASYNTLAFDFPLKKAIRTWNGGSSFSNLKNKGLRSEGLSRFAVTFIDNHDTFHRSDNKDAEFIAYNTNLSNKREEILAANAYILMLPGVPCVFWPHWYTFRSEINGLIQVRKSAGIHSESEVIEETAAANTYSATIKGHKGTVILRMGSARSTEVPAGYSRVYSAANFDIYSTVPTALDEAETNNPADAANAAPRKIFKDGHIYIQSNDQLYSTHGIQLK